MKGQNMAGLLSQIAEAFRGIPAMLQLKAWTLAAQCHGPCDVGPPHYAWCSVCKKPWPCEEWMAATDEVAALRRRS